MMRSVMVHFNVIPDRDRGSRKENEKQTADFLFVFCLDSRWSLPCSGIRGWNDRNGLKNRICQKTNPLEREGGPAQACPAHKTI